jgi:hypothetical protein
VPIQSALKSGETWSPSRHVAPAESGIGGPRGSSHRSLLVAPAAIP